MDKFPRRNLLQALAIGAASIVATQSPLNFFEIDAQPPQTEKKDDLLEVVETKIGNLNTTVLLTEHDDKTTILNFRKIVPFLNVEKSNHNS